MLLSNWQLTQASTINKITWIILSCAHWHNEEVDDDQGHNGQDRNESNSRKGTAIKTLSTCIVYLWSLNYKIIKAAAEQL